MAKFLQYAVTDIAPLIALLFQALVIFRFLDSRNRNYPLAILFTLILFPLTIFAYTLRLRPDLIPITVGFTEAYNLADLCTYILLLLLMLQLTYKTLVQLRESTQMVWVLAGVSALIAITAFLFFERDPTRTRQVVSFWMVLLNLFWWTLLLRKRKVERRVMLLSTGIGLLMTGQVISDGLLILDNHKKWYLIAAYLIMYLTHYACLYSWFSAFRPGPTDAHTETPAL